MASKLLSWDQMENLLGRPDREEESTNRRDLQAAKAVLREAMGKELTDKQRECVRLYFFEGLNQEQTARTLGVGKSTVCRHLQRAKARLKRAVSYGDTACRTVERLRKDD